MSGWIVVKPATLGDLPEVWSGHPDEPDSRLAAMASTAADARLIAAAPKMRDALAGVVAMGCWVPVEEGGTRCAFCNAVNDETHDSDCTFVAAVNALSEADGTL